MVLNDGGSACHATETARLANFPFDFFLNVSGEAVLVGFTHEGNLWGSFHLVPRNLTET